MQINKEAKLIQYQNSNKPAIKITFPFNYDDLDHVKSIAGRRFHNEGNAKYWTCPFSIDAIESLKFWEFNIDPELEKFLQKSKLSVNDVSANIEIPGLQMKLYPFQKQGVSFIEAKNGRALIGDEMGLGKTCQALAYLQLHPEKRPVVIVVPASLKLNWEREAKIWMKEPNIQILSGTKTNIPIVGEIIIINYDILPAWFGKLQEIKPQILITDECHYFKNSKAKRTKVVKALGKNIPHIIALSGTPIVNRPQEILNAIQLIDSTIIGSAWGYLQRYCGAKHSRFGWDFTGASNTEELHEKLTSTIMLRRLKKDVLQDLPDKQYSFLPIELDNNKEYKKAESNFIQWLKENKGIEAARKATGAEALTEIETLKQLAVKGKMKQAIDWIKDFIEVDGKLVVFANHKFVIDTLMTEFRDIAVKIDGSVTGENRDKAVQEFQNNDAVKLFVGNIKAAGVGLTLTAASNVAFLEYDWVVGNHIQAEDRCHRIGQKTSVTIYYLTAINTIEEKLVKMLHKKAQVLAAVLDGVSMKETSIFQELLEQYETK